MNEFEGTLKKQLGERNFDKVQASKIGIAGCGGLGSNCAVNLVRSGFKKIKIIDFDKVEHTNLNRQFYFEDQVGIDKTDALEINLKRVNPDIEIEKECIKLEKDNIFDVFKDRDIIIEAFDSAEYKAMLIEQMVNTGKFIVSVSGLAGVGSSDDIKVRRVKKDLIMIGDLRSDVEDGFPMSPRVNIAAAKQADVVLEYVIFKNKRDYSPSSNSPRPSACGTAGGE